MSEEIKGRQLFSEHISALRDLEFERMKTLQGRGELVFRTDLAILTAAAAVTALVLGRSGVVNFHAVTAWLAGLSAGMLVVSLCISATVQSGTSRYFLTSNDTLRQMVSDEHWDASERDARFIIARRDLESIESLRRANQSRAKRLQRALAFQITFVTVLMCAVVAEVIARF